MTRNWTKVQKNVCGFLTKSSALFTMYYTKSRLELLETAGWLEMGAKLAPEVPKIGAAESVDMRPERLER